MCVDNESSEALSTLGAMRRQEETGYACQDYLPQRGPLNGTTLPVPVSPTTGSSHVTGETRSIMVSWANKIMDFCKLERETVEIAFSYVDRFLVTKMGSEYLLHADKFQLLVITSLYLAIKIHEKVAISSVQFAKISRNMYTACNLEKTEVLILKTLQWRLHPPTSLSFVRSFLELIPSASLNQDSRDTVMVLAKAQTEEALSDSSFITVDASTVAFTAVMNSFEALGMIQSDAGNPVVHSFLSHVASNSLVKEELFLNNEAMFSLQSRLYQAIAKENEVPFEQSSSTPAPPSARSSPSPDKQSTKKSSPYQQLHKARPGETPRSVIRRTA